MIPISACIITLNEENNIIRCINSLDFVQEIIVLDSGSTDQTTQLASQLNAKIFYRKFDTYINQKNHCISLAKNSWILSLDADEVIPEKLRNEILSISDEMYQKYNGFFLARLTYYLGKWIHHGGWYPNYQMRFFRKDYGQFSGILVHETVDIKGETLKLKQPLLHYSYKCISDHLKFIDKYSSLSAMERFNSGKRCGVSLSIMKGIWKFFSMYFWRLGFLDGRVGLIISIMGSYYNFLKYIKVYELEIKSNQK